MYSVSRLFVMFGISVPYCVCLITVGSNPISVPKFDPLRSRANGFIIDTKHLKLVRSNSMIQFFKDLSRQPWNFANGTCGQSTFLYRKHVMSELAVFAYKIISHLMQQSDYAKPCPSISDEQ